MDPNEIRRFKTPEERETHRQLLGNVRAHQWGPRYDYNEDRLIKPTGTEESARAALVAHLEGIRARVAAMSPGEIADSRVARNYAPGEQISLDVPYREAFHGSMGRPYKEYTPPAEETLKQRPRRQGHQLGLETVEPHPAFDPGKNEVIHRIRQENPKMNDYNFELHRSEYHDSNSHVYASHKEAPPSYGKDYDGKEMLRPAERVGKLEWHGSTDNYESGGYDEDGVCDCGDRYCEGSGYGDYNSTPREISWAGVHADHRRQGLGTALFDIASQHPKFEGNTPVHSNNRSEAGFAWSKYVGGDEYERTEGFGSKEY